MHFLQADFTESCHSGHGEAFRTRPTVTPVVCRGQGALGRSTKLGEVPLMKAGIAEGATAVLEVVESITSLEPE